MIRIFLASTQTSSLFAALYARRTASPAVKDILMLDAVKKKESLIHLIKESRKIYSWNEILDFSFPLSDSANLNPSFLKKAIRRLKTKPLIRDAYNFFYRKHTEQSGQSDLNRIEDKLKAQSAAGAELYLLTQTRLNDALMKFFSQAKVNYIEHGLGDYFYVQQKRDTAGNFICLFSEPFKRYLNSRGRDSSFVLPLFDIPSFKNACRIVTEGRFPIQTDGLSHGKKYVLILMENVEMYGVPTSFWRLYIDKCLEQISAPDKFYFLIKPHHLQSHEAMEETKARLDKLNLDYHFIGDHEIMNMGAEVLFSLWNENTAHVFALFSSSLFYLSVLYPDPGITYHYSTSFMSRYTNRAPEQFKKHFYDLEELIEEVFSGNCKRFS